MKSQSLLCIKKAGVKCSYLSFLLYKQFETAEKIAHRNVSQDFIQLEGLNIKFTFDDIREN